MFTESSEIIIVLYLIVLIVLGIFGRAHSKEKTMSDFFLAGRQMGFFVMWLTLFASQYSGNALIGFAAQGYRIGFFHIVIVTGMVCVVGGYLLFAPKLYILSKKHKFITPSDFVKFRFNHKPLTFIVNVIFIVTLANYIVTNLKAIGIVVETFSDGVYSAQQGIIFLAIIMIVYETLGGMRSVAWTDVLQGGILLLGCMTVFIAILNTFENIDHSVFIKLQNLRPTWFESPNTNNLFKWVSTLLLFALSIPLYPHAIQRIYSARSKAKLKKSLQFMAFMPFVTMFLIVILGFLSNIIYPDLSKGESESVMILMLKNLVELHPAFEWITTLFIAAVVAAIMSTVDSALLSLSSIFSKDMLYDGLSIKSEKKILLIGKIFSWVLIALLVFVAIELEKTIWALIRLKLEILIQLAPAFILGANMKNVSAKAILTGILLGMAVGVVFTTEDIRLFSIHSGIWGLLVNFLAVFITNKLFFGVLDPVFFKKNSKF